MIKVSDAYKAAMKRPVQKHRMTGTVGGQVFTDANILSGSFSVTNQCSDETSVLIGQVYIAELRVTLTGMDPERYSLKDKKIIPTYGLMVESGAYENVPLGIFNITEANHASSGIAITAYDNMSLLDRSFSGTRLVGTPFVLSELACKSCGLELGTTNAEFASFANGGTVLQLYVDNDADTWRDIVSWIAQSVGCNVSAGRDGKIIFRAYGRTPVDTIDDEHRFTGCTFGDYETKYTGMSVVNIEAQTTSYYGDEEDTGLTYNLGSNPFLQSAADTPTIEEMRENVLMALKQICYVPFSVTMSGDPAYELMDVFCFDGGIADGTKISCMTKFSFIYNSKYSMQGVGSNPALATGGSKSDKDISGLLAQVESITSSINKLLYDYNTGPITIAQREQPLGMITFYISEQADVEGHFLMSYTSDASTRLILRFYDSTVEELYSPVVMDIHEGAGVIAIPHSFLMRQVGVHGVYVTAQCMEGNVYVDTRGVYFTLDAGNFAEDVDDLSMDVMDITMRQLLESNGPDEIWAVGIEEGKLLVSRRSYSESKTARPTWEGVYTPGKAKAAAIEFDGDWVLRTGEDQYTIETEDQPWLFWINMDDELIAQRGDDESTRSTLETGVKTVSACRGYSSIMYPDQDQGLVAVYTRLDGSAAYKQLVYVPDRGIREWHLGAEIGEGETWNKVNVHRLNDYRLGFEMSNSEHNIWLITERTYVGQSVYPEHVDTRGRAAWSGISITSPDTSYTGSQVIFDDPTEAEADFYITYPFAPSVRSDVPVSRAVLVYVNGKNVKADDETYGYEVSVTDKALHIVFTDPVAATRLSEAKVKIEISAWSFALTGNGVRYLFPEEQDFTWTIERKIYTWNVYADELVSGLSVSMTAEIRELITVTGAVSELSDGEIAVTSKIVPKEVASLPGSSQESIETTGSTVTLMTVTLVGTSPV